MKCDCLNGIHFYIRAFVIKGGKGTIVYRFWGCAECGMPVGEVGSTLEKCHRVGRCSICRSIKMDVMEVTPGFYACKSCRGER